MFGLGQMDANIWAREHLDVAVWARGHLGAKNYSKMIDTYFFINVPIFRHDSWALVQIFL